MEYYYRDSHGRFFFFPPKSKKVSTWTRKERNKLLIFKEAKRVSRMDLHLHCWMLTLDTKYVVSKLAIVRAFCSSPDAGKPSGTLSMSLNVSVLTKSAKKFLLAPGVIYKYP